MKRIAVCLGVTLAFSLVRSPAALLIHESFNYPTGSIIAQTVNATGLNGAATWAKAASSGTSFTVQASSLSFAGHFASSGGSLLVSNPSGPYSDDSVSATVAATLTGYPALYASTVMTLNTAGAYYNDWVIEQRFNSSATGNFSSSLGRNIVSSYGSGSSPTRKGGVSSDSDEVTQATGSLAAGTKYLLVTRYTISGANVTGATFYVFNEAAYGSYLANSTAETADANLATYALFTLTDSETAALSSFDFLQFAITGGPAGQVDEFRLGTAISDVVNLNLNSAPVISGLTDQTVVEGGDVVLNPAVTGTAPITYQWRENGVSLPGETNLTVTLSNVQTNESGHVYSLIATNSIGAATNSMTLTVQAATSFVPLTLNLDINTSGGNNYTGVAIAPESGTYWNSFVVPAAPSLTLSGARDSSNNVTSASITIRRNSGSNFSSWDNSGGGGNPNPVALMRDYLFSGPYTVMVSNLPAGLYDLYVYAHGDNTGQASAVTVSAANGGASGSTTDVGEYRNLYQAGAEGNSYLRLSGIVGAPGVFSFTADYLNGFQLRSACDVSPLTASPTNMTVSVGATAKFIVSTSGSGLTYQWRKNGLALTNTGSVSGVHSNALTISSVALSDLAFSPGYDCVVGTPGGCSVLSAAAKLYVYSTTLSAMPVFPANGATGVCRDTVLRLNFNHTPTLNNTGSIRIYDVSNPNVPVDQIDLSQNVNAAQSRTIGGNSFKAYPVLISGTTATIFPNLNKLAANKTYYVTINPGTFSDPTGALYAGLTNSAAWQFTTKSTGPANSTNLIVAADGSGDFCTVQGALDYLPANNTQPTLIQVRNGQYTEIVNVNNKHKLTFSGEHREQTRIGYPNNNTLNPGAPWRASFVINGNDIVLHTLTLTNMTPKGGGQAEAVDVEGTRTIFYNLNLASFQDTFLSHNSGQLIYFQDSLVQGDTDFMWGYGSIYITNCEIRALTAGAHVTQPRSPLGSNGFAFVDSRITKGFASGTFTLGRTINTPTSPGQVLFMRCLMDDAVTGYASDAGTNMGDYACSNLTATAAKTLANSTHYASGDSRVIAAQTAPAWLHGWVPQVAPSIQAQPTIQLVDSGQAAVFVVSAVGIPTPTYQWRRNGTNLIGQTGAVLNLPSVQGGDVGTYSVIVSNAAGSVTSSNAALQLNGTSAPVFTTQPTNQSASVGNTVNLIAAAIGVPTPEYQWFKNGTNLVGATNATLTLTNVQAVDSGVYYVIASNTVSAATSSNATLTVDGPNGFCMINGITTGGAGGTTVTVTNGTDFITQIGMAGPRIIQVSGVLTIGDANVASSKTILGLGTNATLLGRLVISGDTNIIVRNLRITNPGNDGISIRDPGTHHVWVDHVTFFDCGDGSCDISQEADYVTVSWCKFIYPTQLEHRFVMIGSGISNVPTRITLHHNWWGHRADQRQPASGDAIVHMYNNYFNCTNNSYASNARDRTDILSENNYYSGVNDPIGVSDGVPDGKIRTSGNTYVGCTGTIDPGNDTVFTPPYGYLLDATANVPALVQAGAGAAGPETVLIPPKVWDGGGANNNLNTANNWGLNEAPKGFDTLLFAGASRLTPNNDFTANKEFRSLRFSNNAGAFVLGGNAIKLGDRITVDSSNIQTINLSLNLDYAGDHFTMERVIDVSATNGSLVINGSIVGYTNTFYGKSHSVSKAGPGRLIVTGANSLAGSFSFKGGLVGFSNLGNLGNAPQFIFDGGGLQWTPGTATDISVVPVSVNAGGAIFDVGTNSVTFANPVGPGGAGGLTKLGSGKLTLNGGNSFSGNTLVAAGTLALDAAGTISSSSQIMLSNNAVLDVGGRSDGLLLIGNQKALRGDGIVLGSVTAASGATVAPGFSIGTLVITNLLTLQAGSTNVMQLDAASNTNDLITGMASVSYGGRLVLTNLGGTFNNGQSFKLFSAGSYVNSFASIVWPPLTGNLVWTNRLGIDGTVAALSPVNTAPTNITIALNGNTLQLSWPSDRTGWRLEAQTNALVSGLGTNWVMIPGSTTTNLMQLSISHVPGSVFYRLAYP